MTATDQGAYSSQYGIATPSPLIADHLVIHNEMAHKHFGAPFQRKLTVIFDYFLLTTRIF